jgi:putative transposase
MAETMMGLYKTELFRNPAIIADNGGPWKGLDDLEIATARWVVWFNDERLHSELAARLVRNLASALTCRKPPSDTWSFPNTWA